MCHGWLISMGGLDFSEKKGVDGGARREVREGLEREEEGRGSCGQAEK